MSRDGVEVTVAGSSQRKTASLPRCSPRRRRLCRFALCYLCRTSIAWSRLRRGTLTIAKVRTPAPLLFLSVSRPVVRIQGCPFDSLGKCLVTLYNVPASRSRSSRFVRFNATRLFRDSKRFSEDGRDRGGVLTDLGCYARARKRIGTVGAERRLKLREPFENRMGSVDR